MLSKEVQSVIQVVNEVAGKDTIDALLSEASGVSEVKYEDHVKRLFREVGRVITSLASLTGSNTDLSCLESISDSANRLEAFVFACKSSLQDK